MTEQETTHTIRSADGGKSVNPMKSTIKKTKNASKSGKGAKSSARGKSLVIVESPAKAKTIKKYLGGGFQVLASVGHVIDLPKSKLGVDIENGFKPEYVTIRGKKKVLDALKKAATQAETIYLAPDPDREGEAIAWHVANYLKLKDKTVLRATFNEITKQAVTRAIDDAKAQSTQIDNNLCMAQQTRRILDRLVGYQISPLLWRNVKGGLSAGRVQSVAVRILCEREAEIQAFDPEEYWSVEINVEGKNPPPFTLRLAKIDGKKAVVPNQAAAEAVAADVRDQPLTIRDVEKKPVQRRPQPPFITSSLQQEASRKLRTSPRRTMAVAQSLYEGVDVGAEGTVGLITYMRTDSTRVAGSAINGVRAFIGGKYGQDYLPGKPNFYASKKGAQDAHEAIRPTLLDRPPETLESCLDADQLKLYRLIWNRFVASQMAAARLERTTIEVPLCQDKYLFVATGSVVTFAGFLAVYEEGHDERDGKQTTKEETAVSLPAVEQGETLANKGLLPEQHFTQPPPRFSQSSLIRELEKRGIGRPSTYAAILSTILDKNYAEMAKRNIHPTDLGKIVTDILVDSFPEILDSDFTAKMETELDEIEEGDLDWLEVMNRFYSGFSQRLETAKTSMKSPRGEVEETDVDCEKCGAKMVVKWGKNGHFLSCSNYPECKNAKPLVRDEEGNIVNEEIPESDEPCPKCGSPMAVKRSRRGPFLACTKYPECKGARNIAAIEDGKIVLEAALPDTDEVCEKCGETMVVRNSRRGPFIACPGFPKCRNAKGIGEIRDGKAIAEVVPTTEEVCDKCGKPMTVKKGRRGFFVSCSGYPKCKNAKPLEGEEGDDAKDKKTKSAGRPQAIETEEKCENCEKTMLLRSGRNGYFLACSGYPKCKTTKNADPELVERYVK